MPADTPPSPDPALRKEFDRLFLSAEKEIYRYVMALVPHYPDAEEIVQETALALWRKFDEFDRSKPFVAWACRFAINILKQWAAKRKRWASILNGSLIVDMIQRLDELLEHEDQRRVHLQSCLDKLPSPQRIVIQDRYYQKLDVHQIAERTGKTVDAIQKVLQRTRKQLKQCVELSMSGEEQE